MRYFEMKGGIQLPLSIEEFALVEEIETKGKVNEQDLEERDAELARRLVSRGALNQIENEDNTVEYSVNKLDDIRRD
jgi:hypothetical protein